MDAVAGVLGVGQGHARHAVVAVTQDLDPKAVVLLQNCQEELAGAACLAYLIVWSYFMQPFYVSTNQLHSLMILIFPTGGHNQCKTCAWSTNFFYTLKLVVKCKP